MEPIPKEIIVAPEEAGKRIDVLIRDRVDGLSRAQIRRQIEKGRLLRNGRPVRKGETAVEGDRLDLGAFQAAGGVRPAPPDEADRLRILYEDDDVIVVDKEAGLPTLPRDDEETGALACRLVARHGKLAGVGAPLEGGLVHRLDTDTSGLLVAARHAAAYRFLRDQWRWRRVDKEYVALVAGEIPRAFTASTPIAHHRTSARRMIADPSGRSAETLIRPLHGATTATLVVASLREGRRHQIRVHLAEAGYVVLGDELYGKDMATESPRLMLHAARIRFTARPDGEPIKVVSEPLNDFVLEVKRKLGARAVDAMRTYLRRGSPER